MMKALFSTLVIATFFVLNPLQLHAASSWTFPPSDLSTSGDFSVAQDVALVNGIGVAIWNDFTTNTINGAKLTYATNTWVPTSVVAPSSDSPNQGTLGMDGSSNAIAIWIATDPISPLNTLIKGARLAANSTTWVSTSNLTPSTLGGFSDQQLAVTSSGLAVAVWIGPGIIQGATLAAGSSTWVPTTDLSSTTDISDSPIVGIDSAGNAVAVWFNNNTGTLQGARLAAGSSTWVPTTDLAPSPGFPEDQIAFDSAGNAIVLYVDFSTNLISSVSLPAGSSTWGAPKQVSDTGALAGTPTVVFDNSGRAIALFGETVGSANEQVFSAFLPSGGSSWTTPTQISSGVGPSFTTGGNLGIDAAGMAYGAWDNESGGTSINIEAATLAPGSNTWVLNPTFIDNGGLSSNPIVAGGAANQAVVVWNNFDSSFTTSLIQAVIFIPVNPLPQPPSNFVGKVKKDKFATQTDLINLLTWTPSPDPTVVLYRLSLNGQVIFEVNAGGPFKVAIHNRRPHVLYTYSLVAVNGDGRESTPVLVTLP